MMSQPQTTPAGSGGRLVLGRGEVGSGVTLQVGGEESAGVRERDVHRSLHLNLRPELMAGAIKHVPASSAIVG